MTLDGVGERVRDLRTLLGYTQRQLGDLVEVDQGTISRLERSIIPADPGLIEAIVSATDMPMSFLLADPIGIDEGSLRFRKKATARKTETKRIVQCFIEAYRVCSDLAANQGASAPDIPTVGDTDELTDDGIEDLADAVRARLGVPPAQPVAHVTRILERAGIFIVHVRLPGADVDERLLGHSGASTWRGPWEPPVAGFVASMPGDRLRFTIAHELGHIVMHSRRRRLPNVESEAHRFAAAFLLPRRSAEEAFGTMPTITLSRLKAMKAGWGMAIQALVYRAWNLGFIDKERRTSLMKQLTARGWRTREPVKVHIEQPLLLRKRLTAQYGDPIDWDQAAEDLGLRATMLRALAPEPPSSTSSRSSVSCSG